MQIPLDAGSKERENLIARLEGYCGTMDLPYHVITTEDLKKLLNAVRTNWEEYDEEK